MARSLDNTLRIVQLEPSEWVLCDMHIHAVVDGYAQGLAHLWSESGTFLGTASQSMNVRPWRDLPGHRPR
jgi:acyl-CoA thioesterase